MFGLVVAGLVGLAAATGALLGSSASREEGNDTAPPATSDPAAPEGAAALKRAARGPCRRPYTPGSPWNTPIGPNPAYHPRSRFHIGGLEGELTSDPTQYTYPVYEVSADTPLQPVALSGIYSNVTRGGRRLEIVDEPTVRLPIPPAAVAAEGSDAQAVLVDPKTGDEWGVWQLERGDGGWEATNGYHYNIRWDGVPPSDDSGDPFGSRGAGVPYLAGLVRPCEIARGRIDHALAFAYDAPTDAHVYPATKSDGIGTDPRDMPEGSRLQLDPSLTRSELRGLGCTGPCLVIARALQRYGMFVIDNSGRPKVMLEYEDTARWGGVVNDETVTPIPFSAFRLVRNCDVVGSPGRDRLRGGPGSNVICARGGRDRILAGGGDDVVYGGDGGDLMLGRPGEDVLMGGPGSDQIRGGAGRDALHGDGERDRLVARDLTRDVLVGGPGRDRGRFDRGLDLVRGPLVGF
jgi:hemolysin type calcium-binding protein